MKFRRTLIGSFIGHLAMVGVLLALSTHPAAAGPTSCNLPAGATMQVVRYVETSTSGSPLCTLSKAVPLCSLSGWLYKPARKPPFPTIVLSHSADNPRKESDYCKITEYFLDKGYLVFQPLRRGYRGDAGIGQNTGENPAATLRLLTAGQPAQSPLAPGLLKACNSGALTLTPEERDCVDTKLQESQALELREAIQAIQWLPIFGTRWVDRNQIAVVGHGEGANITALLGDIWGRDPKLSVRAGVMLSTAERTWDSNHAKLKERLVRAVNHRVYPIAFLQPANAASVESTMELADEAVSSGSKEFMASLMPSVLGLGAKPTGEQIEDWFAKRSESVDLWAPLARHFLQVHRVGEPPGDVEKPKGDFPAEHNPAVTSTCRRLTSGTRVTEERYYDPSGSADPGLCDDKAGGGLVCRLKGILYVPKDARNAQAIILNHGGRKKISSEKGFCTLIEYFNRHGFVVFLPKRRGITQIEDEKDTVKPDDHFRFQNTGMTPDEVRSAVEDSLQTGAPMPREAGPYVARCHLAWIDPEPADWDCLAGELMRDEASEVGECIKWLKKQNVPGGLLVDPAKVAIMGHSNGAQVVIHAGAKLSGEALPKVIIAVSPHERGWKGNKYKGDLLRRSVENAKVPFAIVRPANAPTLDSTEVLGKIAARERKQFFTQVFPPMLDEKGKDDSKPHVHFVEEFDQIVKWATAARRYMAIFGVEKGEP